MGFKIQIFPLLHVASTWRCKTRISEGSSQNSKCTIAKRADEKKPVTMPVIAEEAFTKEGRRELIGKEGEEVCSMGMLQAGRREGWGVSRRGKAYLSEPSNLKEEYDFQLLGSRQDVDGWQEESW